MRMVFYLPVINQIRETFEKDVISLIPESRREVCQTLESFAQNLRKGNKSNRIAVIVAATKKDILDLCLIRDLLSELRIILILPDNDKSTIALGHTFYPRFLDFIGSDFFQVTAVMKKMMGDCLNDYKKK